MPFITIKISEGHSVERKRKMAEGVTRCVASVAEIPEDYVQIVFQDVREENWAAGGKLTSDK